MLCPLVLFLTFNTATPTGPQLLCTTGFGAGIAVFFYGLRLRRNLSSAADYESKTTSNNGNSIAEPVTAISLPPMQEIIRLSPDQLPLKSSEMTQQQKIAAALARAGIPNLAARIEAQPGAEDSSPIAVEVARDLPRTENSSAPASAPNTTGIRSNNRSAVFQYNLMLLVGPLLSLISLYLFLSLR